MARFKLNGKEVSLKEFRKGNRGIDFKGGVVRTQAPGTWPMHSDAAGVNPNQREEAYRESVASGVPTHFDSSGCAIFTSQGHRRKYCEAHGLYDRNGGYGDPQRK